MDPSMMQLLSLTAPFGILESQESAVQMVPFEESNRGLKLRRYVQIDSIRICTIWHSSKIQLWFIRYDIVVFNTYIR